MIKNLPANAGNMDLEDTLEKEMAIHSSILAWENSWTEEPGGLKFIGFPKSRTQLNN